MRHICPAALLSAAAAAERHGGIDGVLVGRNDPAVTFRGRVRPDRVARWKAGAVVVAGRGGRRRPRPSGGVGRFAGSPGAVGFGGLQRPNAELAGGIAGITCVQAEAESRYEAAARHADRILSDAASPWIDLRRDALAAPNRYAAYRRPLGMLAATAVLLLVCVSIVTQWRGRQYQSLSQAYAQRQAQLFRSAMPNQHVPGNVRARLASEHRRLAGMGGQAVDDGKLSAGDAGLRLGASAARC